MQPQNGTYQPHQHQPVRPRRTTPPPTPQEEQRHNESVARFPQLKLSHGEYVIDAVRRHPIGLISIWAVAGLIIIVLLGVLSFYGANQAYVAKLFLTSVDKLPSVATMMTPALILIAFVGLGGFIATIVYNGNRFYLTNESIIQFVQYSLFDTKQQVVNLINVEDASSTQHGIVQQLFNYGTLRLSTQGEETIYHFRFTANPKRVVNEVNEAMETAVRKLEGANYPPTEY